MDDEISRNIKRFRDQIETQTQRIEGFSGRQDDFNGITVQIRQDLIKLVADNRETLRKVDLVLSAVDKIGRKLELIASA